MEKAYTTSTSASSSSSYTESLKVSVISIEKGSLGVLYGLTQLEDAYYSKVLD